MNAIRQLLKKVKSTGTRLAGQVKTVSMGRERVFEAYDLGDDTFVVERGIGAHLAERPSVLVVDKRWLRRRVRGKVMTVTTGNHAVAAMPLLDGRFWRLSSLAAPRWGDVMTGAVLCANIVDGRLEVSQRDVSTPELVSLDRWLVETAGLGLDDVVMLDRNESALDHYRRLGQEWRVKPLAWTEKDMLAQLAASRKRISSKTRYYHSSRGVHFMTYPEFMRMVTLAETSPSEFVAGLREIVSIFEGNSVSFARMPKYRGHHEIEFFGLGRGVGVERVVPELEKLMEAVALGRLGQLGVIQKAREAAALYQSLLTTPDFADESSPVFVEKLYMYVTGEIYSVAGDGSTPSFDDRRTALPGATFVGGRPVMHPGADVRSEVLLSNLRGMLSKDEFVEYANVYELREDGPASNLRGRTREVVYKTNMRPLETSLIEKGLLSRRKGYAEYMLARIGALRAMGVTLSAYYRLLRRRPSTRTAPSDFYIRMRCEGEPLESIPACWFRSGEDSSVEVPEVVMGLAALMGDAAAQNMAMKKFDPETESPLYGVGKEIYEFEYDIIKEQVVPKKVATCSIRGSFGWPDLSFTDANVNAFASFYFTHFAHALKDFCCHHTVPMADLAERFMSGFEFRTHAMAWQLSVMRDRFESFSPPVPPAYRFAEKWRFAMWALERQERRLSLLRKMFFEKVALVSSSAAGGKEGGRRGMKAVLTSVLAAAALSAAALPLSLDEIREPVIVGVPPIYAGHDLCTTADGAIRHYGQEMHRGKVTRVYVESRDGGLTWKTFPADPKDVGAVFKSPWSDVWVGFTNRDSIDPNRNRGVFAARSRLGPGDTAAELVSLGRSDYACTRLIAIPSRRRWLASFVELTCRRDGGYGAATAYSDDDGRTWRFQDLPGVRDVRRRNPGSARDHWYCSGCEPALIELKDGSILMCLRTSGPHAAFLRSTDGGETWGAPWTDSRFWQANTRPEFLRLRDGRLLFVWNNTQLLPELDPTLTPQGERGVAGFTNRDALHAAISEDDGKTWIGFRELALSEYRNSVDWRELGNDDAQEKDKSVHQTQMLELAGGKVLIAYGQNVSTRRLAIFDPAWLYETKRMDSFRQGLAHVSHHLYLRSASGGWRGWAGHCAWNRIPGAAMVLNPDISLSNRGDVLQLGRLRDPRLYSDRAGLVWNFPAAKKGAASVNCRIVGEGFRFTLSDHWMNPCDETNPALQPVSEKITSTEAPCRRPIAALKDWHNVAIEWDCAAGTWRLLSDGHELRSGQLAWVPAAGFSYLHLQTLAEGNDPDGTHFRNFTMEARK